MQKHLLKKSLPAALVAGALVGVGAQQASADAILFPYLSTSAGILSFVTIVNDVTHVTVAAADTYHFTYGHKAVVGPSDTAGISTLGLGGVRQRTGCEHYNADGGTTPNDMMTFEVNGRVMTEDNAALWEGPPGDINAAAGRTSTPVTLPVADRLAFLSVENNISGAPTTTIDGLVGLFGWAEVIDVAQNSVRIAYSTHNFAQEGSAAGNGGTRANFSNLGSGPVVLSWYPTSLIDTSWTVLPLGPVTSMSTPAGGALRGAYTINAEDASPTTVVAGTNVINAVWDRDETSYSGARTKLIRCMGSFTRNSIMQSGALAMTVNGGYTFFMGGIAGSTAGSTVVAVTDSDDPGATYSVFTNNLVHKTQYAKELTGLTGRTFVSREPHVGPGYAP